MSRIVKFVVLPLAGIVVIAVAFALKPSLAFALDGAALARSASEAIFGAGIWIAIAIAYFSRRRTVGGWLLVYYLQLYTSCVVSLGIFGLVFKKLPPSDWDNAMDYVLFLLSYIPPGLFYLAELLAATWLLMKRALENLRSLRWVLIGAAASNAISLGIDVSLIPEKELIPFHIMAFGFSLIWCAYFFRSRRVRMVFVDHSWDYAIFSVKRVLSSDDKRRVIRRTVISGVTTFVVLLLLMASVMSKPEVGIFVAPTIYGLMVAAIAWYLPVRTKGSPRDVELVHDEAQLRGISKKQKFILGGGAGFLLMAMLFPPFIVHHPTSGAAYNSGFSFLFSPSNSAAVVNVSLLAVELVAVGAVTAVLFYLSKRR